MSVLQLPDTLFIGLFLDAMAVACHCSAIIQHLDKGLNMPQGRLSIAVYSNASKIRSRWGSLRHEGHDRKA